MKHIICAAFLGFCVMASGYASPTLQLAPRAMGGNTGVLSVRGFFGGATGLTGAEIHIKYDATKVSVKMSSDTFTPGDGWTTAGFNVQNGEIIWVGSAGGTTIDGGTIVSITLTAAQPGSSTLTLTTASGVSDSDYTSWPVEPEQTVTFPFVSTHAPTIQLTRVTWTEVAATSDSGTAANLTAVVVHFLFDPALVSIDPTKAVPGTGWQQSSFQVAGTEAVWKGVHTGGTNTAGEPIVRIPINRLTMGPVALTLTTNSSVSDENGTPTSPATDQVLSLAAKTPSQLSVASGGARTGESGSVQVMASVGESQTLTDAEINIKYDPLKLSVLDSATSFITGDGWAQTSFSVTDGEAVWKGHYTGTTAVSGPVVTVRVWRLVDGAANLTLTTASSIADETLTPIHPTVDQVVSFGTTPPARMYLDPGVAPAGQAGQFRVLGDPAAGHSMVAVEIHILFDAGLAAVRTQDIVPGPGWVTNTQLVSGNEVIWVGSNGDGLTVPGSTIVAVTVTPTGSVPPTVTLTGQSNFADDNYEIWYLDQSQISTILPGQFRDLHSSIMGAPAAGPGNTLAVVAGKTLRLLNAADLTDVSGFIPVPLGAQCEGRPAFGVVGGVPSIAVGTTGGDLIVVNMATGAPIGGPVHLGSGVGTPAIDNASGAIYVGVNQPTGNAVLDRVAPNGTIATAPLGGTKITSSPALVGGCVAIGTNAAADLFRVTGDGSLVPQATVSDSGGFSTSPVVRANGAGMITAGGNMYQFDLVRGVVASEHLALSTQLAEGWYDYASDAWYYGGSNGHVYQIVAGTSGPTLVKDSAVSGRAIGAQVMGLGSRVYAIDVAGQIAFDKAGAFSFRGSSTRALAATGREGSLIVSDIDGGLASLPF